MSTNHDPTDAPANAQRRQRGRRLTQVGAVLGLLSLALAGVSLRAAPATASGLSAEVVPSTELTPGQIVTVRYAGFTGATFIAIRQCRPGATTQNECGTTTGVSTPDKIPGTTTSSGAGTARFALQVGPIRTNSGQFTCDPSTPCTVGVFDAFDASRFATVTVSWAAGSAASSTTAPTVPDTLPPADLCPPDSGDLFKALSGASGDQALRRWSRVVCQSDGLALPLDVTTNNSVDARALLIASAAATSSVDRYGDLAVTGTGFTAEDDEALAAAGLTKDDFVFIPLLAGSESIQARWATDGTGNTNFLKNVYLTPQALAGMYSSQLSTTSDPVMASANSINADYGLRPQLSDRLIDRPIARAEHSAETAMLIDWMRSTPEGLATWLKAGAGDGPESEFNDGPTDVFPAKSGLSLQAGAYNVASVGRTIARVGAALFSTTDRSIAVMPNLTGFGAEFDPNTTLTPDRMTQAWLQNPDGTFLPPTDDAVKRGLAQMADNGDGTYSRRFTKSDGWNDPQGYPLPVVSYAMVPKKLSESDFARLNSFLSWAITEGQKPENLAPGYVPLPTRMAEKAAEQLAKVTTVTAPPVTGDGGGDTGSQDLGGDELGYGTDFGSSDLFSSGSDFGGGTSSAGYASSGTSSADTGSAPGGDATADAGTDVISSLPILALLPSGSATAPATVGLLALLLLGAGAYLQRRGKPEVAS